ncbi:CARDB domain-containing protein [Synechococcus sp. UW140]|uniref:CARDB domain-containing protein n=1 Tax=Synechococcus sp. UW140 TaxID=368503 RepID=UPI0025FC0E18|nr:CARDB domain-containing protein [Synechococcus sp. UW140]
MMQKAGVDFWIANTITDLIQGDVKEHLPMEAIPLDGDVLGMGTTTSIDNGELSFLLNQSGNTTIWKCEAADAAIRALRPGDGSAHFPYVCFTGDASSLRVLLDPAELGEVLDKPLQAVVANAIELLKSQGRIEAAPIYGFRLELEWQCLVITVASKLCMGQQRRNSAVARSESSDGTAASSIYDLLQHYRLAPEDPAIASDPVRYLGNSLDWDCCGFFDTNPSSGRVTVPNPDAHLHLHGCSSDLRYGGHLHHEHPGSRLKAIKRFAIYPLQQLHRLSSDLAIEELQFTASVISFTVVNRGAMDVSDVGVAIVVDDCYSSHQYLRLPWLAAAASEQFELTLCLASGPHRLEVIADPEGEIIEQANQQCNNRAHLDLLL